MAHDTCMTNKVAEIVLNLDKQGHTEVFSNKSGYQNLYIYGVTLKPAKTVEKLKKFRGKRTINGHDNVTLIEKAVEYCFDRLEKFDIVFVSENANTQKAHKNFKFEYSKTLIDKENLTF